MGIVGAAGVDIVDFSGLTSVSNVSGGGGITFDGLAGNDTVIGTSGDDIILGGLGIDKLEGGDGEDTLIGGAGADKLSGGDGDDLFFVSGSDGVGDIYDGGSGTDTLDFDDNAPVVFGSFNAQASSIEVLGGNGGAITGTSSNDVINLEGLTSISDVDSIVGAGGNDLITGSYDNDVLLGGIGNDTLNGGGDDDELWGEAGNDTLNGDIGNDFLYGGLGSDTLTGGSGDDTFHIKWGEGADKITDFVSGDDLIQFDFPVGMAAPLSLISGSTPTNAGPNAAFLYDEDDGRIFYDAGPGGAVLVATLTGAPTLQFADFVIT
jgi:Ca2+-binding RTX toxin-like protein